MKKYLLFTLLFILAKITLAQNTNLDYKYALKIYNSTSYEEFNKSIKLNDSTSAITPYSNTELQILHPSLAFQWKTSNSNFHEIELTSLMLRKLETEDKLTNSFNNNEAQSAFSSVTTSVISIRYEYIFNFNKTSEKKLVPSLGFGLNPYFKLNNFSPSISTTLPTSEKYFGLRTFVNPRLSYFITPRLFIDLNIPLCFFDTHYHIDKAHNPSLPVSEMTTYTLNFNQFPKIYGGRIGIGIKL